MNCLPATYRYLGKIGSNWAILLLSAAKAALFLWIFCLKIANIPNKYGLMYKNIRYNTGCNRTKVLNNVLNVQKTLFTEP